jgi:predicted cupin superfamily sugar epimerase
VHETLTLGADIPAGQRPQLVIDRDWWQSAKSLGDWTLVGCTVAPGFDFKGFEMAPEGWEP